ncbi:DUF1837 domain-containing protein [Bradyrhizobium yuanmingense]|uniref:HamA C-terminal domain-containing protein n=1 Tax=Bradyrhizobium yuanmingense TaxID=108015 RepID=UPI0021A4BB6E|nr:DUF1837 domain-containing protein [Bradyrhizobium sp. CB1024]UWU84263.1 DUF1837 domain-containing protein [Bradyrhizobium sp. CB1024]
MEAFIAALAEGHDDLPPRIRTVTHSTKSNNDLVRIHAHFLSFRAGQPTVEEFVNLLSFKLVPFCLHRKYISAVQGDWATLTPGKIQQSAIQLNQKAIDLFKRAHKKTNRNGEFGELIAYLLIESVLKAPQFVAKMSLKTSPQMPVHGSDGIHISYDERAEELRLYWGESKCYSSVKAAIKNAVTSVADNLEHQKMSHELFLVEQYFDQADFPEKFKKAILSFLNPYDENYNKRTDVSVVLIVFDFAVYAKIKSLKPNEVEQKFVSELCTALKLYADQFDKLLKKHDVKQHNMEVFFLPLPSVDQMRSLFQDKIGWTP